jgi:hypothetical protein
MLYEGMPQILDWKAAARKTGGRRKVIGKAMAC